jgi:hypothetical protein
MLAFSTQLCELYAPLTFSLVHILHPSLCQSTVYTGGGGGCCVVVGGLLCWRPYSAHSVPDQIQNLQNCFPTQNKNLGGEVNLRKIGTCRKVPLQVNFVRCGHFALLSISLIYPDVGIPDR